MTVRVVFCRKHHVGSLLLRAFLWSGWSHCAIIDGDEVIEAVAPDGVRARPRVAGASEKTFSPPSADWRRCLTHE